MDTKVNYGREVRYQAMRTARSAFFPVYMLAVIVGSFFLIISLLEWLRYLQFFACWLVGEPQPAMVSLEFWDDVPRSAYFWVCLRHSLYCAAAFAATGLSFAAATPYMERPNMPTYRVRACRHCGGALANHNFLTCPSCRKRFPSGLGLALIRGYGLALTVLIFSTMIMLFIIL